MGHVRCVSCNHRFKRQPVRCNAMRLENHVYVVCGGEVFAVDCAKCFASEQRSNGFDGSTSGDTADGSSGNFFAPGCGD